MRHRTEAMETPNQDKGTTETLSSPFTFSLDELLLVVVLLVLLAAIQMGVKEAAGAGGTTVWATISPDGSLLASAFRDRGAVYDIDTGALLYRLPGLIQGMEFSPDGRWLAVATFDHEAGGDGSPVPGQSLLLVGARDGTRVFAKDFPDDILWPHSEGIGFALDGSLICMVDPKKQALLLLDPETGQLHRRIDPQLHGPRGFEFVGSRQLLVVEDVWRPQGNAVRLFDTESGKCTRNWWWGPDGFSYAPVGSRDGHWVVAHVRVSKDTSYVFRWDIRLGQESGRVEDASHGYALSSDGRLLVTTLAGDPVVWDFDRGEVAGRLALPADLLAAVFLDGDRKVMTVDRDRDVTTWDLKTMTPLVSRRAPTLDFQGITIKAVAGYGVWLAVWFLAYRRRRRHPERPTGGPDIGVYLLPILAGGFVLSQLLAGRWVEPYPRPVGPWLGPSIAVALGLGVVWFGLRRLGLRSRLLFILPSIGLVIWFMASRAIVLG